MAQVLLYNGADYTAYLAAGSLVVKLNTCDFSLIDVPGGTVTLGAPIILKDPGWAGVLVGNVESNIVDVKPVHRRTDFTAINSNAIVVNAAPFAVSDTPVVVAASHFLKEDGSGVLLLEDGSAFAPGDYALEDPTETVAYQNLRSSRQVNSADGSITQVVSFTIFRPGLWPGMTIDFSSGNPGVTSPTNLPVTQVSVSWPTGVDGTARFDVECGFSSIADRPWNLNRWRTTG